MYSLIVGSRTSKLAVPWDAGVFEVPKERFCEFTEAWIVARYSQISDSNREELLSLPCLFVCEGEKTARLGRLTSISERPAAIRIKFSIEATIQASIFETLLLRLDIGNHDELLRSHWAIKDEDVLQILAAATSSPGGGTLPAAQTSPQMLQRGQSQRTTEKGHVGPEVLPRRRTNADHNQGLVVGNWRLGIKIGAGQFGRVYEAVHEHTRIEAVAKLIPVVDDVRLERFKREARALADISHPQVPVVHDAGIVCDAGIEQYGYIVQSRVHGADLQCLLDNGWTPSESEVLAILDMLTAPLAVAHDSGIVHRDLKPSNLLLDETTRLVHVLDFGCAKLVGASKLTRSGAAVGAIAYQPPEAFQGVGILDASADVWMLGVLVYELLTQTHPFIADDVALTMAKIARCEYQPLDRSRFPFAAAVVEACLRVDPGMRPSDAAELRALLRSPRVSDTPSDVAPSEIHAADDTDSVAAITGAWEAHRVVVEDGDAPEFRKRLEDGESLAWAHLARRTRPAMLATVGRVLSNAAMAEDVVQETLSRAFSLRERLSKATSIDRYVIMMSANIARDAERKVRRRAELAVSSLELNDPVFGQPLQSIDQQERRALGEAMKSLDPVTRSAIVLFSEGNSWIEIAEALRLPVDSLRMRVTRGLKSLRGSLLKAGIES